MTMRTDDELLDEIENANNGEGPDPIASYSGEGLQAILAAVKARRDAQAAIDAAVAQARDEGATWTIIGSMLGISKQAAAKRYGSAA